jgi:hypothetical protein
MRPDAKLFAAEYKPGGKEEILFEKSLVSSASRVKLASPNENWA